MQLDKIELKELRIKEAYRNGIDTLDEYRENKNILSMERSSLQEKLESLSVPEEEIKADMPNRIKSVTISFQMNRRLKTKSMPLLIQS